MAGGEGRGRAADGFRLGPTGIVAVLALAGWATTALVEQKVFAASAQNQDKEVGAASGDGAADEDRGNTDDGAPGEDEAPDEDGTKNKQAPKSPWTFSGLLNRALLAWQDGGSTVRTVDNNQDSSGVKLEGKFPLVHNWTMGVHFSLDTYFASSESADQRNWSEGGAVVELTDAYLEIGHGAWGNVIVGQSDSASDELDKINLSKSDAVADASIEDWFGNAFLRIAGRDGGLTTGRRKGTVELRWGDFINGPVAGDSGRFITYVSPEVKGFELSTSVGQPQDIFLVGIQNDSGGQGGILTAKENGVFWDAALRYKGDLGKAFHVEGGLGFWRDTTEEKDAEEPTKDTGVAGSLAIRHVPTGLNIAVNYGLEGHNDQCAQPGVVTGNCRGDDQFLYVKGGLVRENLVKPGQTAIYGEFYRGWRELNSSDEGTLRTLERNPSTAQELAKSRVKLWGVGVVQNLKQHNTDLYIGYRHYALDVDLIGVGGPVPARDIKAADVIMTGVTIRLGHGNTDD
jgi:hypothetical protein